MDLLSIHPITTKWWTFFAKGAQRVAQMQGLNQTM
jgi:hypothetical protein